MLSEKEKMNFKADGVVCLRNVLDEEQVASLRKAVDDQMSGCKATGTGYNFEDIARQVWSENQAVNVGAANRFDMQYVGDRIIADRDARPLREEGPQKVGAAFFYDVAGWKKYAAIRETAFDSALPQIASELLSSETIHFWEDTTFIKTPGTKQKTAFHQDYAYFQISGEQCVVMWLPLDPAGEKNGVVRYVRGSHRWNRVFAPNLVISQTVTTDSTDEKLMDIEGNEDSFDIVSFEVTPGDVICHHVMTVHGSGGNMSSRNRRALSFRYCGDDIRYFDRPGAIPQSGVQHALRDGQKLYSADYPMVWPKPWPGLRLSRLWRQ